MKKVTPKCSDSFYNGSIQCMPLQCTYVHVLALFSQSVQTILKYDSIKLYYPHITNLRLMLSRDDSFGLSIDDGSGLL